MSEFQKLTTQELVQQLRNLITPQTVAPDRANRILDEIDRRAEEE